MTNYNSLDILNNIFRKVLKNNSINLKETTTANDISNWDSLANIKLIVEIEKRFKIKFSSAEIYNLKNIGDLVKYIKKNNKK